MAGVHRPEIDKRPYRFLAVEIPQSGLDAGVEGDARQQRGDLTTGERIAQHE